jgi:hypothetical protein
MDTIITRAYTHDLSGADVNKISRGKAKILLYKDLVNYKNIEDAVGPSGQCIMLFPTGKNNDQGHWVAIIIHEKLIIHFDPYGLSPKKELGYSTNEFVKRRILNELYDDAQNRGFTVDVNKSAFQKMKNNINTCGRHSALRCRFAYLNNDGYTKLMCGQKFSADWLATIITFLLAQDDVDEKQQILKLGSLH